MGTKKEENKKDYTIVVIAIVVVIMIAWAVGVLLYNKGNEGAKGQPGEKQSQEEAQKTETQETDFTQWVSDSIEGSYYIPNLLFDTEDAKTINAEIAKAVEGRPTESTDESPYGIGYNAYYNKGVLSLEMIVSNPASHYYTYNVDTETGARLSNSELLTKFGVKEESALEAIKSSVSSLYKSQYVVENEDDGYKASLDASVAEVKSDMQMYLNDRTSLCAVVKLHEPETGIIVENLVVLGLDDLK